METHLKGMLTVLAKLDPEGMRESVLSPLTIDPLTMLIWRMAKRIDFIASIASGEPPVLPRSSSMNVIKAEVLVFHRSKIKFIDNGYCRTQSRTFRLTMPIGLRPGLH